MTKPTQAIETFKLISVDNRDILLSGLDGIQNANIELSSAHYYKQITDDNSIQNVCGLGPENTFFYTLISYKDNAIVCYEKGLGYAYSKDGQTYFKRETPLLYGKNENHVQIISDNKLRFYSEDGSVNVITSELPPNLSVLFYDKNCIIVSINKFTPKAIQLLENSFLARVNDNDIANLSFDSKTFSDIVAEALTKYTKQIALKCSKLNANKLAIKQLQLESSDGTGAKAGTFIYDQETDTVKFYNGTVWRSLKWADEEKAE